MGDKASESDVPATQQTEKNSSRLIALVKGARGVYSIGAQPIPVQEVCKEAILNFEVELVFHSCFPLSADRIHMSKVAVIKAATDLQHDDIVARVKEDSTYCRNITSMV